MVSCTHVDYNDESIMTKSASGGNVWDPYKGGKKWNYHFPISKHPKVLNISGYVITLFCAFLLLATFSVSFEEVITRTATTLTLKPVNLPWFALAGLTLIGIVGMVLSGILITRGNKVNTAHLIPARLILQRSLVSALFVSTFIILLATITGDEDLSAQAWLEEKVKVTSQGVIPTSENIQNVFVNEDGDIVGITMKINGGTITYTATINPDTSSDTKEKS
jgi:hypothetical protein